MNTYLIPSAVFVSVSALVGAVAFLLREGRKSRLDDRLSMFTGTDSSSGKESFKESALMQALEESPKFFEILTSRFGNLRLLFEQADTSLTPTQFFIASGVLGAVGAVVALGAQAPLAVVPVAALTLAALPLGWLMFCRRRRLRMFQVQLPDALELIGRALRAGHSLGAGFNLVQQEMRPPIAKEFGRVFEESNLGIPMEEALMDLTQRVPNLDLKFFATAVVLQRQTGGDLAEILDKISRLIRERFQIWGQVQALTGEGRLSGVVLLALPPALFAAVWRLNPEYVMPLFTDPLGTKMLVGALVLQLMGAIVIKKIVNIKV